jgi:hypothetical protein
MRNCTDSARFLRKVRIFCYKIYYLYMTSKALPKIARLLGARKAASGLKAAPGPMKLAGAWFDR